MLDEAHSHIEDRTGTVTFSHRKKPNGEITLIISRLNHDDLAEDATEIEVDLIDDLELRGLMQYLSGLHQDIIMGK